MAYMAHETYGGPAPVQPTPTATPDHAPGPVPMARTTPLPRAAGHMLGNPTLLLVGLLGAAIGLVHVSVRVGS
jgi:hypothetical protein